ncbi:hypothetical protein ACJMK2_032756 [Sinanodonta woodiana]|uniref:Cyclic nucleotide-binding domain-containing protein n=1 Tax=Sinanodonta woodiana TaxID=1069815 RepID=A0ABD3X686_SINWO
MVDNLAAAAALQNKKKGRAFITFVPDENRELVQLSFDVTEYMRNKKAEDYLTDDIRKIMKLRPGTRNPEQIAEVVRCMKGLCKSFNEYPLAIQKEICQSAFFDKYRHNRVILRRGLPPDGIYFVLSGQRKHFFISLFTSKDIIFSHFPLNKLKENPGTWSMLKYKYGRLIVKDSNELEWIYVIKSGEARVLKNLEPGRIDVQSRRKKIQEMMEEQSPFHKKKKILSFIAEGVSKKSMYHPSVYQPNRRRMLQSAPSGPKRKGFGDDLIYHSLPSTPAGKLKGSRPNSNVISKTPSDPNEEIKSDEEADESADKDSKAVKLPTIKHKAPGTDAETLSIGGDGKEKDDYAEPKVGKKNAKEEVNDGGEDVMLITMDQIKAINDPKRSRTGKRGIFKRPQSPTKEDINARPSTEVIPKSNRYIHTPTGPGNANGNRRTSKSKEKLVQKMELPAFVQIETLHPGQTFGLRSCLESDERGPSVSLISGECEVIAINKKFFMRHCDDAMYSLIRLKAKPFPTQEELVDRLDANMQWEEFKQETLHDFLKQKIHTGR